MIIIVQIMAGAKSMTDRNSGWSPKMGDHKRDSTHTNRSVVAKKKRERIRLIMKFVLGFIVLLTLGFLGQSLICNTTIPVL